MRGSKNLKKKKKIHIHTQLSAIEYTTFDFCCNFACLGLIDQKEFSKSMEAGIWRSFYKPKETARYPNYYLAKIRKKEKNNRKEKEVS